MKKIISALAFSAVLMLICTGCGQQMKDTAETMASEAMEKAKDKATEIMSGEDGKTKDGDGFIGDETTGEQENATVFEATETYDNAGMNTEETDNFV